MTKILHQPKTEHHCYPGKKLVTITPEEAAEKNANLTEGMLPSMAGTFIHDDLKLRAAPEGTVIQCDCGQIWVKDQIRWEHRGNRKHSSSHLVDNQWHRETRREHKKRIKRESDEGPAGKGQWG